MTQAIISNFFEKISYLWAYKGLDLVKIQVLEQIRGGGKRRAGTGACPYGICEICFAVRWEGYGLSFPGSVGQESELVLIERSNSGRDSSQNGLSALGTFRFSGGHAENEQGRIAKIIRNS